MSCLTGGRGDVLLVFLELVRCSKCDIEANGKVNRTGRQTNISTMSPSYHIAVIIGGFFIRTPRHTTAVLVCRVGFVQERLIGSHSTAQETLRHSPSEHNRHRRASHRINDCSCVTLVRIVLAMQPLWPKAVRLLTAKLRLLVVD